MSGRISQEHADALKKSRKSIAGELYPILEAADGEIIDGYTREEAGWESRRRLPQIKSKLDKLVARVLAHQRRNMPFTERRDLYDAIAEELIESGIAQPEYETHIPEERRNLPKVIDKMADILGVSEKSIATYISDKYKRGAAGKRELVSKRGIKRSKFQIRADVLEILDQKGEMKPTNLMYKTNLSWRPLNQHLAFLYKKGLINVKGSGSPRYFVTEHGRQVLKLYSELKSILLEGEDDSSQFSSNTA